MSADPYIGEIMAFAGNFAPRNWARCEGQLLPISQNTALFSLLGTTYGGDGRTTFGLPDLNNRLPMHAGRGPGLSSRRLGERGGQTEVQLTEQNMPPHTHTAMVKAGPPAVGSPASASVAQGEGRGAAIYTNANATGEMLSLGAGSGGTTAHSNMQPALTMTICICLVGEYPSRS